jgi:hypothetical protein
MRITTTTKAIAPPMSAPIGTLTKPDGAAFCPRDVDVGVPDTEIVAVGTGIVPEVVGAAVNNGSHNCWKSFADERLDLLVLVVTST